MNEDPRIDSDRITALEDSLRDVRKRLQRIELRLGIAESAPATPPPARMDVARPTPPPPRFDYIPPPIQTPSPKTAPPPGEDAEFRFGSIVLPRVGAGIVLLGVAYLVGLSIARGWITPWMQFWGAALLCLGFIGAGFWKRQERFDFGQVLIGLGSCGLYLTAAVGHAFHNLFSGEVLVGAFVVLSFLNLAYGAKTPSRTFVGIGLLGGLAAALLPMREEHVLVSLGLNLAIALPAAAIVAWHRWRAMAMTAWTLSMAAMAYPVFHAAGPWREQVGALYLVSFVGLLAYARSHEGWEFDPPAAFIPLAALLTALLGFGREYGSASLWHELAFGGALAFGSLILRPSPARSAMLVGGLLAAFVFAPFGQPGTTPIWAYLTLALAAAGLSLRAFPKAAAAFAGLGLGLGAIMYAARDFGGPAIPLTEEVGLLSLALAALTIAAASIGRRTEQAESATFVGLLLAAPIVSRIATLLMGLPAIGYGPELATMVAALALAAGAALAGTRMKWMLMAFFAWGAFFLAAILYAGLTVDGRLGSGFDLTLLSAMLAVTILNTTASGRIGAREGGLVLAGFVGWGIFSRMVFVIATLPSIGMTHNAALTLGWTLYALLLIGAGFAFDQKPLRLTSLAVFGATVTKVLLVDLAALDSAVRVGLLLLLGGGLIAGGYAYIRRSKTLGGPPAGAAV